MRTLIKVIFLVFISIPLACLPTGTARAQQRVEIEPTSITIADGLTSTGANSVIQDSYGLIWIATDNGLQRYDGTKFETFKTTPGKPTTIHHNRIWDVFEDDDSNIWCATEYGVSRYDRKRNEFKNFTFGADVGIALGQGRTIHFFKDSQNRLWAHNAAVELVSYDREIDQWKGVKYPDDKQNMAGTGSMSLGMTEDADGGLWLGSGKFGLMYYAKSDSGFRLVKTDIPYIDATFITALYWESPTSMYITTVTGVYKYNPSTNVSKQIEGYANGAHYWNSIKADHDGNVWILNNWHGALKFNPNSDEYERIFIKGSQSQVGNGFNYELTDFMIDRSGIFWIGTTGHGMLKYDPANKPFSFYKHDDDIPTSIAAAGVYGILESKVKPGIIYLGSRGFGYQIFDRKKQTTEKVPFKSYSERFKMYVRSLAEDPDGSLWVGSWEDGLLKFDKNNNEIARYAADGKPGSISNPQVRVIKHGEKGKLYVGTNAGLNILDIASGKFNVVMSRVTKVYPKAFLDQMVSLKSSPQSLGLIDKVRESETKVVPIEIKAAGKYVVFSVGEGDPQSVADNGWIENAAKETIWSFPSYLDSYYAGGAVKNRVSVQLIDLQPGNYSLHYATDDSHSYDGWNEDKPEVDLWGISLIKPKDQNEVDAIEKIIDPKQTGTVISGNNIMDIAMGKKYIWVGSLDEGLTRIDRATDSVKYYLFDPNDDNSISSNTANGLYENEEGKTLWIATIDGLNRLDIATGKITRYSEPEGLSTNLLIQVVPGDKNELWITTQSGISQMLINDDLGRVTFINYNSTDGIGGNNFITRASVRTRDGQYYFGGDHGLTTFNGINADKTPPSIVISNISISNKPMAGDLLSMKEVDLSYDQNNLSFEFAALHYANPKKNQLAHKLDGYDKDWIYDNRNFASYTNLDPGTYTLRIRASNAYGIWNEEGIALKIVITPPWWRTWWAYTAYVGLFGLVAFQGNKEMQRSVKRRERERSREKELAQAKEIEKAYTNLKATQAQLVISEKMASLGELTAGIAHEIQNPLNFVNNFSEINKELIEEMKAEISSGNLDEAKSIADTIAENESKIIYHGKRADGIVKGMLQHSRTSSGQKEPADINALSDEYLRLAYHGLRAKDKSFNATMKTDFDPTLGKINVIPQDLGRVILNLITNAFYVVAERKNNSAPGTYEPTVGVTTKRNGDKVEIRVVDNGKGIPPAIIDKIFQPFFTTKPSGQGTGLGLSLSYEIVTKGHGGELKVETMEGVGTTFIIIIPA